ncbi:uncharacterized protein (UPF0305 family) [Pedobacter sp. CAN_A7]|uniref:PIN domain-containing protein n=1 Tax=Pedobacter sp. CAN_A7 TaxID=2787722 RepID=UPI0018CBD073
MIYLAIDTDVWLWLSYHRIDSDENYFDELLFWLQSGELRCIVPENIIREWERNKQSKVSFIKRELSRAAQLNKDLFRDPKFLNTVYKADKFEAFANTRIERVEEIFKKYADVAPLNDQIKLLAADRTLERLAPSHDKDSFSDAVNMLSLIEYARMESLSPIILTTKNYKDYSDPLSRQTPHPQLIELFDSIGLEYIYDTDYLFGKRLRPLLPNFNQHLEQQRANRAKENLKKIQAAQTNLANADQDFIGNTLTIDHILEQAKPTLFQQKTIKELIENDLNCRKYFFSKITSSFWFSFLQQHNYLNPATHPLPEVTPEGTFVSRWEVIPYLERLSVTISQGQSLETVSPLLQFIADASQISLNNDLTFAGLINILNNLPNAQIDIELLDKAQIWLTTNCNRMMSTSAICSKLLPKFLESGSPADSQKAERILVHLFGISRSGIWIDHTIEKGEHSYFPNAYPSILANNLLTDKLIEPIAKHCSLLPFYQLARNLKVLLLDFPKGMHLKIKSKEELFTVLIQVELPVLILSLVQSEKNELIIIIKDYEALEREVLEEKICKAITDLLPDSSLEDPDMMRGLLYALTVDKQSMAGSQSVRELTARSHYPSKMINVYSVILSRYLLVADKHQPVKTSEMLHQLFDDPLYKLPIFRRIVLHHISINFKKRKNTFFALIEGNDRYSLFSDYLYRKEMFELLRNNQSELNAKERKILEQTLNAGPKENPDDPEAKAHWQARWALAMNQTPPFDALYQKLKNELKLKDKYVDPTDTFGFRSASVAPMSAAELSNMDDQAIVKYMISFRPTDDWEEPNISGLASIFEKSVTENPTRFLASIDIYLPAPYIYIHHLLYTLLSEGQKNPENFNWTKLLHFCSDYIHQDDFMSPQRSLNQDRWSANKNWILAVVSVIIGEVCRHDDHLADHKLLPVCRKALLYIDTILDPDQNSKPPDNDDYLSSSVNSDSGKFFRACMDYDLAQARASMQQPPEWDQATASIYNKYILAGDLDTFTIIGFYWPQFSYLNQSWIHMKIKDFQNLDEKTWKAFMGGFLFSRTPATREVYELFYPHYHRAIQTRLSMKNTGHNGLATHVTTLYFWEMEELEEKSITLLFIQQMPVDAIKDLLHSIWFNDSYLESLNPEGKETLERRIIALINRIHELYATSTETEFLEMRRETVNILYLIEKLNSQNTEVIKTAILLNSTQYHYTDLFEKLFNLLDKGEPMQTAVHLAEILEVMNFGNYLMDDDQQQLEQMIQFLYNHQQKIIGDKLCNRLSQSNHLFAKALFLRNTAI